MSTVNLNLKNLVIVLLLFVAFQSCKKTSEDQIITNMEELVVSENFDWQTTNDFKITVNMSNANRYDLMSKVSVYRGDPHQGGKAMVVGSVSNSKPFEAEIRLPQYINFIYLKYENVFEAEQIIKLEVNGQDIQHTIDANINLKESGSVEDVRDVGPDCESCDNVISGSGSVSISGGETYCVTDSFTGSIDFQAWNGGGTLQVCGNASVNSLSLGGNCHIVVTQGGNLTVSDINMWSSTASVIVYENATLTISSALATFANSFENQGTMVVTGDLNIQNLQQNFVNSGLLQVSGNLKINNSTTLNNSGTIEFSGSNFEINNSSTVLNTGSITSMNANSEFQINNSSLTNDNSITIDGSLSLNTGSFTNNCKVNCTDSFNANTGTLSFDGAYLRADNTIHIVLATGDISFDNASMFSTVNMTMEGSSSINGSGDMSSIKVEQTLTMNSFGTIGGNIEVTTDDFVFYTGDINSHIINGATLVGLNDGTNFIPINACNPEGAGQQSTTDTDLDGVPDDQDAYPNDETKAFNTYYPAENTYGGLGFEDYWPTQGDYDFNDLVLLYNINHVSNAQNQIVEIVGVFTIKAVGAGYKNGFGLQLPITDDLIETVVGSSLNENYITLNDNNTEAGQSLATVIVFDNTYNLFDDISQGYINTSVNQSYVEPQSVTVTISFTNPISPDQIGVPPYNPFLIVNGNRDVEVHLPDNAPTSLADQSLFGTSDDDSNPAEARYYKTVNNLPWCILLSDDFDYPLEKKEITQAYVYFGTWAQSDGGDRQDWYLPLSGYRNTDNIYSSDAGN